MGKPASHSLKPLDVLRPTGVAMEVSERTTNSTIQQTRQTLRAGWQSTRSRGGLGRLASKQTELGWGEKWEHDAVMRLDTLSRTHPKTQTLRTDGNKEP